MDQIETCVNDVMESCGLSNDLKSLLLSDPQSRIQKLMKDAESIGRKYAMEREKRILDLMTQSK